MTDRPCCAVSCSVVALYTLLPVTQIKVVDEVGRPVMRGEDSKEREIICPLLLCSDLFCSVLICSILIRPAKDKIKGRLQLFVSLAVRYSISCISSSFIFLSSSLNVFVHYILKSSSRSVHCERKQWYGMAWHGMEWNVR